MSRLLSNESGGPLLLKPRGCFVLVFRVMPEQQSVDSASWLQGPALFGARRMGGAGSNFLDPKSI